MRDPERLLMVCYAFPPVGGAGVQRSVKFAKYLTRFGWRPTVLTVCNPSVPVLDTDLSLDLSNEVSVLRARTLEPSYRIKASVVSSTATSSSFAKRTLRSIVTRFLQPDAQVLWNGNAFRLGVSQLLREPHSAIYVSGPPFSSFLLGCRLKERFGLPLILDFRDEWSISAQYLENRSRRTGSLKKQMSLFEKSIRQADAIIATTMASAEELKRCCKRVGSDALVRCIYNGFDADDLKQLKETESPSDSFRLVYTGTLWNLTDISPFVQAVLQLCKKHPAEASRLQIQFVGRRTLEQDLVLDSLAKSEIRLHRRDYSPHHQSMQIASEADALLLTLADQPGAERVVPGKMFEYMALNREILGLAPDGETRQLLSSHAIASCIYPGDQESIVAWLLDRLQFPEKRTPTSSRGVDVSALQWCNRLNLTGELVELIEEARST